jgi:hypothetical protein
MALVIRPVMDPLVAATRAKLTLVVCPATMVIALLMLVNPPAEAVSCTLPAGRLESVKFPLLSVVVLPLLLETVATEIPLPSDARVTRPDADPVVTGGLTISETWAECCTPPPFPFMVSA